MSLFHHYLIATRPKTLIAAIAPVILVGKISSSASNFSWWQFLAILFAAICIQIITNFVNDLFDYLKGADQFRDGPTRALQSGLLSIVQIKRAIIATTILTVILGLFIIYNSDLYILIIGLVSILFAFLYTAGPYPLAYFGLAEVFVFIFFGPVATIGTSYALTSEILPKIPQLSLILGCLASAIVLANNLRDYQSDKLSNKKTIVVFFGEKFGFILLFTFWIVPLCLITNYWQAIYLPLLLFLFLKNKAWLKKYYLLKIAVAGLTIFTFTSLVTL